MKIYICQKSISDLKNPIVKKEYETDAATVQAFIEEMVQKNYTKRPIADSLQECQSLAVSEFTDGSYYIVNTTKDRKYRSVDEETDFSEGDEVVLIKLKYVRGIIW